MNVKKQGDFAELEAAAMKKYFGINVKPQQLVSDKPANIQQPKMDPSSIDPDTFIWEATPRTNFDNGSLHRVFAFMVNYTNNNVTNQIMFVEPISLLRGGSLVEVKFTFDHQTVLERERNLQGKYQTAPTVVNTFQWSCNDQTGERDNSVYYGVMVNDFTNNYTICWVPCGESSSNRPLPPVRHARIPRRPSGPTRTNSGELTTFPAILTYYNSQSQKSYPVISNTQVKISREVDTDRLDTWQNAQQQLLTDGGQGGHRYWV